MAIKKKFLLVQIGSPSSTKVKDVRRYLREFLSDPRVIDTPRILWFFILNLFILPFRPKKSAEAYKRIEFCGFFPLVELTNSFARKLTQKLDGISVESSFLLSKPLFKKEVKGSDSLVIIPQFPQFSDTTTSSVLDMLEGEKPNYRTSDNIQIVRHFHKLKAFIDCSVNQITEHLEKYPVDHLVLSFHGIPLRYVTEKKDPYYYECFETFYLLKTELKKRIKFEDSCIHMTFQSRLGSEQWLSPYTDEFCRKLAKNSSGVKIGVYCPSFVVDCLETTDEIGNELGNELLEFGGELVFIPSLNVREDWCHGFGQFIEYINNNSTENLDDSHLFYQTDQKEMETLMPEQEQTQTPLSPKAKTTIKLLFLTLFLDLIGFSIIFPMFPALAEYYLNLDPENPFLKFIFGSILTWTQAGGVNMNSIVLFGGVLGALYSLLQFLAAPIWGSLSDKFGRKPILLVTIFGLMASYIIWGFSGSFTWLIFARFIGGIMGGNISTATAAIADVTDKSNRSKGMAFVGIAFALGFIFGPAIGGILTAINPLDHFPSLEAYGINPFSYPAFLAAFLSAINLLYVYFKFEETLQKGKRHEQKTINILKLFSPLNNRNVNFTNYAYFIFIAAFSGMEFTLTFLAVERFSFSSLENAYMFVFIGFIIAFVQGGVVRRRAHAVGEKKMAMIGLASIIPGLLIISFTSSIFGLYMGLFFLAIGSAMAIPTLTSLVSLHSPDELQGKSIGIFRSLGSLGRIIGPIAASIIYWKFNSSIPYLIGAGLILMPMLILKKVEEASKED